MNRFAQGSDGRDWVIRAHMEWRRPATAEDFEHDAAANRAPGIAMMCVAIGLALVLLVWMPEDVVIPTWVPLALLLVALFFPLRWVLRRPWTVVAETEGDESGERPSERWVGTVVGMFNVRGGVQRIAEAVQKHDLPDFDGPLRPVE